MNSNITKLSLGSFLALIIFFSCSDSKKAKTKLAEVYYKKELDTCLKPDFEKGSSLEFKLGCGSCHAEQSRRNYANVPTIFEISRMDSLKLRDFIFITKHKGYFKKEPFLRYKIKTIDSLSTCDRKNLIHYIKEYSRQRVYILHTPADSIDKK